MILITGGTGFIGQHLVPALVESGQRVRLLLRPSIESPRIPRGVSVEVAVSSFNDLRGIRAAMKDVDTVFHLAGAERYGSQGNLNEVDIQGTKAIAQAAKDAKVSRLFMLSHLGANRSSAFPVLKAKAIAENWVMDSGVPYTIFRTDAVYGAGDQFTVPIKDLLSRSPGVFLLPGQGENVLQPLWINDLITTLVLALEDSKMINRLYSIGGIEILSYREIVKTIMLRLKLHRLLVPFPLGYLRRLTLWVDTIDRKFPISTFWLDTLAENRTATIDLLPREFGVMPARFHQMLDYLTK
ncbi:MAG: SDR family oxidoreductase [Anaerolineaceae bacterium]